MNRIDVSDVLALAGLGLMVWGLAAFDWRAAIVGVGVVLLLVGLAGAMNVRTKGD